MRGDRSLIPHMCMPGRSKSILQLGSAGQQVAWTQERLTAFGFDPGGVDGQFGILTEEAVRAFQRAYGLRVDGKVGPLTRRVLSEQGVPRTVQLVRVDRSGDIGSKP
ncbi:MAG TPA: peptidoglycan-binding domain-containing protein [Bacillota bacterium]|nr:peptidoglycan-binding domain-containing protein [Bacillota bacterium]HPZ54878.1 peptidoglycan-binding domain-containing protein [Bacillota bacterium]HQD17671.1 peptidoglycan-binding domain-containing protein [Bacillota bacterium]